MPKMLVLLAEGFEESEAIIPIDVWRRAGFEVVTMALHDKQVMSSHRIPVTADVTFDPEADFDGLFLPGGGVGTENLRNDPRVIDLIIRAQEAHKWLTAICAAPTVLGSAGALINKWVTSHPSMKDSEALQGAFYREDPVVIDGKIITSRGVGTAMTFALAVAEKWGADVNALKKAMVVS
jgi:4-methyl-5(b-hydroxyethyl)-thiazole monophosphate biosynthesis